MHCQHAISLHGTKADDGLVDRGQPTNSGIGKKEQGVFYGLFQALDASLLQSYTAFGRGRLQGGGHRMAKHETV